MSTETTTPLEARINELEDERTRCKRRIQEIDALLAEKYRDWHAARMAARAAQQK